jgi:perosamine synthetase
MIPLSVPNLSGNEWKYIKECLDTNWVSSVGSFVTLFENKVAEFCGVKKAIATSNGTAALHISLMLAGVKQNDLVILPNITFVAPANAIKYTGADTVLIDVDAATWQMDLDILEEFLKANTSLSQGQCIHKGSGRKIAAIVPVHVLGNMCDMERLVNISQQFSIPVVEDSTEALGSYYKGKHGGSFGLFGCLSFNGNKIITTGGGGMILTNDEEMAKKAKHLTTQAKASAEDYYHDEVGYNYRLVNILAAMGVAQMEQLPGFLERKKEISDNYNKLFKNIQGAMPQQVTDHVTANNWLYTIHLPNQPEVRKHLLANKIEVRPFWVPMNQLPAFKNDLYINTGDVSGKLYSNCLSLPCSTGLTDEEQKQVIGLLKDFYHD